MRLGVLLSLLVISTTPASWAAGAVLTSTAAALESQLACLAPPRPALAIRTMLRNGLLAQIGRDPAGVPIFRPTAPIRVFDKPLLFITGWELGGGGAQEPFRRTAGASPPVFLAVILDAAPGEITYREQQKLGDDGMTIGPFSSVRATSETYAKSGTTITCYGE